ncbi:hypothetical protein ACB092_03G183500 [Castanea dentata]
MEHRWRHSRLHNGLSEKRKGFLELQVEKIQEQLDRMPNIILGKHPSNKKRQLIGEPNWSKVSILYKLPYWKNKKLKHNIDVMHVENVLTIGLCIFMGSKLYIIEEKEMKILVNLAGYRCIN